MPTRDGKITWSSIIYVVDVKNRGLSVPCPFAYGGMWSTAG